MPRVNDVGSVSALTWGLTNAEPFSSADQSAVAAAITAAPSTGKKLVIVQVVISVGAAMKVTLSEETSGNVINAFQFAGAGSIIWTPPGKKKLAVADKKLMVRTSAGGQIDVLAGYRSEA